MNRIDDADEFSRIFAYGTELQTLLSGFRFLEGPVWHPDENFLIFSDIEESCQYRWSENDGVQLFRRPSNQANGNAFDLEGRVVSCEHASSAVVRHDHGGKLVSVLATHHNGVPLNSPNDIVVDGKGRIWFTDPSFGRIRENLGIPREEEAAHRGVYRLDSAGDLQLAADDFDQPNGLCFTPDQSMLLINDSARQHIRLFEVLPDGGIGGGDVLAEVTGNGEGVADGMKVDIEGRIFCTGPGGVHVFSPRGRKLGELRTPEQATNLTFGGSDLSRLIVTCKTAVYYIDTASCGIPAF